MKHKKSKKPQDLGIKIVSREVAMWTKFVEAREETIKTYEDSLVIERAMLIMGKEQLSRVKKAVK